MEGRVILGRYKLIRVLGRGGMGAVWLAEHVSLGTSVAIKLINSELANHAEAQMRFAREAQVAARIRSVNVVQIHDHGVTEDGQQYIAMEYLTGESLGERLATRRRLPLGETARIIAQVCRGIARAHEAGLVHRDLKPENIFIAREGNDEIVKVLDFGVAKVTDALAAGQERTRTGALLGTPHYMSPEQAQGLKTIDARSDLWALGVVTFECLTGVRPFAAPALGPLIAHVMAGPIPAPSQAAPDAGLPPELDAWMARALSRPPEGRFASAHDFARELCVVAKISFPSDADTSAPRSAVAPGARTGVPSPFDLEATVASSASARIRLVERDRDTAATLRDAPGPLAANQVAAPPAPRPPRSVVRWLVVAAVLGAAIGIVLLARGSLH